MNKHTEAAYRAWREAAEKGYGASGRCNPASMAKVDARIRRLKATFERSLTLDKREAGADDASLNNATPSCPE